MKKEIRKMVERWRTEYYEESLFYDVEDAKKDLTCWNWDNRPVLVVSGSTGSAQLFIWDLDELDKLCEIELKRIDEDATREGMDKIFWVSERCDNFDAALKVANNHVKKTVSYVKDSVIEFDYSILGRYWEQYKKTAPYWTQRKR